MPVFGKTRLFNYLWFYIVSYFLGAGWVFLTFKSARLYAFANKGFLRVVMPMFICAAVAWFLYRDIGVAYSVAISCMLGIGTGTTLVGKPPTKNNG